MGRQLAWPAAVQRAVWQIQVAEKAVRDAKGATTRARKAMGLPALKAAKPKRFKTKALRERIGAGVRLASSK